MLHVTRDTKEGFKTGVEQRVAVFEGIHPGISLLLVIGGYLQKYDQPMRPRIKLIVTYEIRDGFIVIQRVRWEPPIVRPRRMEIFLFIDDQDIGNRDDGICRHTPHWIPSHYFLPTCHMNDLKRSLEHRRQAARFSRVSPHARAPRFADPIYI